MDTGITVVISTYNGAHKLPGILNALKEQSFKNFELIVIVDGSTDNTMQVLEKFIQYFDNSKIYRQENRGRAAVRNRGAKEASGDLIIFFDDDMRPEPDCIEQHSVHHDRFPNSLSSGAQIDDMKKAANSFAKYKSYLSNKWAQPLLKFDGQVLPLEMLHLTAANFSVSKKLFFTLGAFDERLNDAEDFDLAIRTSKAGIPIYYNHKAFSWHDDFVTIKSYIKRLRQYQAAHINLRNLKPEIYKNLPLRAPMKLTAFKSFIFSIFANSFLLNQIERNPGYLDLLPDNLTYKIYDWVTTAYGVVFINKSIK